MKINCLIVVVLISVLVVGCSILDVANAIAYPPTLTPIQPPSDFCNSKCGERCSKAGKRSRCMRYCVMCCGKCKCVPPGTYGNKDHCPCYRDWKSPNGKPKCP